MPAHPEKRVKFPCDHGSSKLDINHTRTRGIESASEWAQRFVLVRTGSVMDYVFPVWRNAANSHMRRLHALQSKYVGIIMGSLGTPPGGFLFSWEHLESCTEFRFQNSWCGELFIVWKLGTYLFFLIELSQFEPQMSTEDIWPRSMYCNNVLKYFIIFKLNRDRSQNY